jgi:hypothetical protein
MKRFPIARITNGKQILKVYYDNYYIEDADILPERIPKYILKGDEDLRCDFNHFAFQNGYECPSGHSPYPWSIACSLAYGFAKKYGLKIEDLLPEECKAEMRIKSSPNARVY